MTRFNDLHLAEPLERALQSQGYTTPTPIQQKAIPQVLRGRDLLGIAQTGTGKTAAFALPLLDHISRNPKPLNKRNTRILVLAPTRELAGQIGVSFESYSSNLKVRIAAVFGGAPIRKQIRQLERGVDVLVATPGRLLDLVNQKAVFLSQIEALVLDEADQMMDLGFIHDLRKIAALLPKERQTLFFSATMPKAIKSLAAQFLTDPVQVAVTPNATTAERVQQCVLFAKPPQKQALLEHVIRNSNMEKAIVFTRTKHGADRVVKNLTKAGIESSAIHGNKSQSQRERALAAFRKGYCKILVATDIAARGIDVSGVSHVINFEMPNVPEQYVHRIGRTARAGNEGLAVSFVANDERNHLRGIEKLIRQSIPVEQLPEGLDQKINHHNNDALATGEESGERRGDRRHGRRDNERRETRRDQSGDARRPFKKKSRTTAPRAGGAHAETAQNEQQKPAKKKHRKGPSPRRDDVARVDVKADGPARRKKRHNDRRRTEEGTTQTRRHDGDARTQERSGTRPENRSENRSGTRSDTRSDNRSDARPSARKGARPNGREGGRQGGRHSEGEDTGTRARKNFDGERSRANKKRGPAKPARNGEYEDRKVGSGTKSKPKGGGGNKPKQNRRPEAGASKPKKSNAKRRAAFS